MILKVRIVVSLGREQGMIGLLEGSIMVTSEVLEISSLLSCVWLYRCVHFVKIHQAIYTNDLCNFLYMLLEWNFFLIKLRFCF